MNFIDYLYEHFECDETTTGQIRLNHGECPFCGRAENTAIVVSIDKSKKVHRRCGICFHCSTGFSAVDFITAYEGVDKGTVKKRLNNQSSGYVRTVLPITNDKIDVRFPKTAVDIRPGTESYDYLVNRGITQDTIDRFNIKFCPDNDIGQDYYLPVNNRILFYIYDRDTNAVAWQARALGQVSNKYLFSKGFKASEYLYNCWNIESNVDSLIICEGIMDLFGWYQNGYTNVVATFGKKISLAQMKIILDIKPKVVYNAWDYDTEIEKWKFQERYGHLFDILNIQLDGKDADECTASELKKAYMFAKPITYDDYITSLMG